MQLFCTERINNFNSEVKSISDYERMLNEINLKDHKNLEKYWHRFTNLINIDMNLKKYLENHHE